MASKKKLCSGSYVIVFAVVLFAALASAGCKEPDQVSSQVPYSTYVLQLPEQHGELRRTPVVFDHAGHIAKLDKEGCVACHTADGKGGRFPLLETAWPADDRDDLMQLFHDGCVGCHKQTTKGPLTCGECHLRQAAPERQPLEAKPEPFMDKLHDLHTEALDGRCGDCHHVFDEAQQQLVYKEGSEGPCTECHKRDGEGKAPSLRSASHVNCVGCHLDLAQQKERTGAVECEGCHTQSRSGE